MLNPVKTITQTTKQDVKLIQHEIDVALKRIELNLCRAKQRTPDRDQGRAYEMRHMDICHKLSIIKTKIDQVVSEIKTK